MATQPIRIRHYYQNREEVLQFDVWYLNSVAGDPDPQDIAATIGNFVDGQLDYGDFLDACPPEFRLIALEVFCPGVGDRPSGRYQRILDRPGVDNSNETLGDMITVRWVISGDDVVDGKTKYGGVQLSGVPENFVDCNIIADFYRTNLLNGFASLFPVFLTGMLGDLNARLSLRVNAGKPDERYVPVDNFAISNQTGSRIDRIHNRPNNRPKAIAV